MRQPKGYATGHGGTMVKIRYDTHIDFVFVCFRGRRRKFEE